MNNQKIINLINLSVGNKLDNPEDYTSSLLTQVLEKNKFKNIAKLHKLNRIK